MNHTWNMKVSICLKSTNVYNRKVKFIIYITFCYLQQYKPIKYLIHLSNFSWSHSKLTNLGQYRIMDVIIKQFNIRNFYVGLASWRVSCESTLFTNNTYKYDHLNGIKRNKRTICTVIQNNNFIQLLLMKYEITQ